MTLWTMIDDRYRYQFPVFIASKGCPHANWHAWNAHEAHYGPWICKDCGLEIYLRYDDGHLCDGPEVS